MTYDEALTTVLQAARSEADDLREEEGAASRGLEAAIEMVEKMKPGADVATSLLALTHQLARQVRSVAAAHDLKPYQKAVLDQIGRDLSQIASRIVDDGLGT
jgi:hypothetical protein